MKTSYALIVSLVGSCLLWAAAGLAEDKAPSDDRMDKKLEYSKNILTGLATDNFDLIVENAEALNELGKKRWVENVTPAYRTQHQVFWFANEELIRYANEENIDGATLAYVQMTVSCVNCHKVLRTK